MLKEIDLSLIKENTVALRTVNKSSEQYLCLVDSVRAQGILNPVVTRERKDEETGAVYYEIVEGLHRLTAAREAGLTSIPSNIRDLDDDQVLEAQLIGNVHRIETKPAEYSRQLRRIIQRNQLMTESELASKIGKSPAWIGKRLSLNKIDNPKIQELINNGDIVLANAFALASLPTEEMPNYIQAAVSEPCDTFVPTVSARVKEIKEADRKGKKPREATFTPVEYLQKTKDIKEARSADSPVIKSLIIDLGIKDPIEAAIMMLNWILNVDPISLQVQKEKYDLNVAEKAARAAKAKEAAAARKKEAAAKAEDDAKAAEGN